MSTTTRPLQFASRRKFLATAWQSCGALSAAAWLGPASFAATEAQPDFAFFVVGDTHYLANRDAPQRIDPKSAEICERLVDTLNRLPSTPIPEAAGGGKVQQPLGVIHVGDVIDTGDKPHVAMQQTELAKFREDYGLTGKDGRLKLPVFEIAGNHDAPRGEGAFIEQIQQRNKARPGVVNVSKNGVHYAWDWGQAHFVNLGLIVGADTKVERKRRYASLDSLSFLIDDLRQHVGTSGRPVILSHHIDIARYSVPCDPALPPDSKEWDPCDVQAFHSAIKDYNVAGIFYGHTHARAVFQWDGQSAKAKSGIRVFNTDNASHFAGDTQAFFYVESHQGRLLVREYQTRDRWQTGEWTRQSWAVT